MNIDNTHGANRIADLRSGQYCARTGGSFDMRGDAGAALAKKQAETAA